MIAEVLVVIASVLGESARRFQLIMNRGAPSGRGERMARVNGREILKSRKLCGPVYVPPNAGALCGSPAPMIYSWRQ